jgi:hypothetical protein
MNIETYIDLLLKHYELDRDALTKIWLDNSVPVEKIENPLLNLKLTELKELCKAKGLPLSGTKQALVDRLTKPESPPRNRENIEDGRDGREVTKKSKKKKSTIADILVKLSANKENVHIRRNLFDHYEHMETGLVFDEITGKVLGKQLESGDVAGLTETDMEVCKECGFTFDIPDIIQ